MGTVAGIYAATQDERSEKEKPEANRGTGGQAGGEQSGGARQVADPDESMEWVDDEVAAMPLEVLGEKEESESIETYTARVQHFKKAAKSSVIKGIGKHEGTAGRA